MTIRHLLPLIALPLSLNTIGAYADTFGDDFSGPLPLPEVLTPVRLKQPRTETPASVTVIDHKIIEASGIRELPELLRLVPGMAVGARSGWDYVVSYHGTNRHNAHRMQVLIDGRSVYQAGLATINWDDIPLAIEDIERIEVTRGPDTAAYGANAFLGIINIITKHPDDSSRYRAKATRGNNSTEDYYLSTSDQTTNGSYRITAAARRDNGFDHRLDGSDRRDFKKLHMINGRWMLSPSSSWSLDLQAGFKRGINADDANGLDRTPPDNDVDNYFASINSQHFLTPNNSLKWQLNYSATRNINEWNTCSPASTIDPSLPSSLLFCGDINNNVRSERTDFDIQDTWLPGGAWKVVTGAHAQHQHVDSQTYYSGSVSRATYQLFGNVEYRFAKQWSATFAGSHEFFEHGGHAFSPRLALMYFPSENQSIRAVYSEAIRTPDLFENHLKWHYIATNLTTVPSIPLPLPNQIVLPTLYTSNNIGPEHIRSHELGYYGLWFERRLQVDMRLYDDDLYDLISDNPNYSGYTPTNNDSVKQFGYETEIKFQASEDLQMQLSYALIHSRATTPLEEDLTPNHSGSAAVIYDFAGSWEISSFYYYAYPINGNKFSRGDVRVAKRLPIYSSNLTISMTVQHYFEKEADLFSDNLYTGPNRIYLSADLRF